LTTATHPVEPPTHTTVAPRLLVRVLTRVDESATAFAAWPPVVFLTLGLATVVSVLSRDGGIKRAWPFFWGAGPWSWTATGFWSLVVASATFAYLKERKAKREKADERTLRSAALTEAQTARREAQDASEKLSAQIVQSTIRLERVLPSDLLGTFDEFFVSSHRASVAAQELLRGRMSTTDADKAAELARSILLATASLAQKFERSPADVTFSANVMWYHPWTPMRGFVQQEVKQRLRFHAGEPLDGVLDLLGRLSIVTDPTTATPSIDFALPAFAMPVPQMPKTTEDGWITLPGAPHAFCTGEMDVCPSIDAIIDQCDRRRVRKHLSNAIRKHMFEEVPHIQSFVSLPLARSANRLVRIGVLNINCSRPNMLQDPEAQKLFFMLVRPLLWMMAEIVVPLEKKYPAVLRHAVAKNGQLSTSVAAAQASV
jgi:hypothetical protein